MLKNVVLPAPFGPIRLTIVRSRDREVDVVHGDEAAELLAHALGDEQVDLPVRQRLSCVHVVERLVVDALVELRFPPLRSG